jgi:DNA-binding transcriptional regulator/RsmH inhibitor MraZ
MVSYETEIDEGERLEGTVVVPARYEDELKRLGSGLMIYRGRKTSQAGRMYNDVCVLSPEILDTV